MTDPLHRFYGGLNRVRRLCPDLPVLAIQWMTVKHPIYAVQERLLKASSTPEQARPFRRADLAKRCLQCGMHAASLSVIIALLHWQLRRELAALKRRSFDLIAKTWCFGPERLPGDRDFYYGDLQRRLAGRGIRMLLVCGHANPGHTTLRRWRAFARAHGQLGEVPRLPALSLSPLFAPFRVAAQQVRAFWRLGAIARRARTPLLAAISLAARRDALSPQTMDNALLFWIAKSAVARWRPRAFMALYEANSWERCAWWGVKTAHPACLTVGYQHTVLFPYARSLLRPYVDARSRSLPDVVLCLGRSTRERLREGHEPHQVTLIPFGSFRYNGATPATFAPVARRTILVVPETGILREGTLLFEFAMQAAGVLTDHQFIFRCHPIMPFSRLRPHLQQAPEAFPNIQVSEARSFEQDCARSSIVLYRGSSSVFYAVLHGLKPIYLHDARYEDGDPLFELTGWRERVASLAEFAHVVKSYALMSAAEAGAQWKEADACVRSCAIPVTETSLTQFLEAVGMPQDPSRS